MLTVGEGVAEAPIVGGCLTLVASSLGTPYEIETDGCIVLLEDLNEELDELVSPLGIPAIANVPVGHGKTMVTIPLGARARLDATAKTLDILEAGVT